MTTGYTHSQDDPIVDPGAIQGPSCGIDDAEASAFWLFVESWTGRDMAYPRRQGTVGLEFALACLIESARLERSKHVEMP